MPPLLPDPMEEPTISVERAGKALGICRDYAYQAARSGELPTIRLGRRLLVPTAKLRQMLGLDAAPADDPEAA